MELIVTFSPLVGEPFPVVFHSEGGGASALSLLEEGGEQSGVQGDMNYCLSLDLSGGIGGERVTGVSVLVNGTMVSCVWRGNTIEFAPVFGLPFCMFQDSFGFAQVELVFTLGQVTYGGDSASVSFVSAPLPVLVREGPVSRSVEAMADFVFENQEILLSKQKFRQREFSNSGRESGDLETRLSLVEEILAVYEGNVPYFKTNCRFRMAQVDVVDRMEKLQQVTPRTVAFTAQHPEFLKKVSGNQGVLWSGERYLPSKTLVTQNMYSKDIYENKMVVSFLHCLLEGLEEMALELTALVLPYEQGEHTMVQGATHSAYLPSYRCILGKMSRVLLLQKERVSLLQERCLGLALEYHRILEYPLEVWERLEGTPRPTAILLTVPQYHGIYTHMDQWFHEGMYDFGREQAFLSCIQISTLYEQYLLTRFIQYFQEEGWERERFYCQRYGPELGAYPEHSREVPNSFVFSRGRVKVSLFYQPNIYDSDHRKWNAVVGLYRNNNNTLHLDGSEVGRGNYYQPDFVFRIQQGGVSRFVIVDGKFSSLYNVKQYYLMPLIYKYLFSLTPVKEGDVMSGLAVFYGKCSEDEEGESAHNKQISPIRPYTELFPFVEGIQASRSFLGKMLELD